MILDILDEWDKDEAIEAIKNLDLKNGQRFRMKLAVHKKRSPSQNNLFHAWCAFYAREVGSSAEYIKQCLKEEFLPMVQTVGLYGEIKMEPMHTSDLSKQEFSDFLEKVYNLLVIEMGCRMPWPHEPDWDKFDLTVDDLTP